MYVIIVIVLLFFFFLFSQSVLITSVVCAVCVHVSSIVYISKTVICLRQCVKVNIEPNIIVALLLFILLSSVISILNT